MIRNLTHTKITGLMDCKHFTNTFDEAMRRLDKKQIIKPRNSILYLEVDEWNRSSGYLLWSISAVQ